MKEKGKKYILVEFPYPSGSGLHVGHAFTFTGGDVYARFKRMQGYEVMFPMGWDAFGLPTENYAIKTKRKPQEVTRENTSRFKEQMKALGFSFDWEREINTTDPNYYKWTQWIFIQLFKKGLAYKREMPINWCPSCKVGLANEEVVQNKEGKNVCERCGAETSRRNIAQWIVKITDYADKLVEGLKETEFIEKVKAAQINWIGRSQGARIKFSIFNFQFSKNKEDQYLEVFTTRPDTLYGATFMVVAPEHDLVNQIVNDQVSNPPKPPFDQRGVSEGRGDFDPEAVKNYVANARKKSDLERAELNKEKTGVFSGLYVINPVNGKEIPIWISDFVLASYGTGAIMAVPAHDERDWAFAKKFGLPIVPVIEPDLGASHASPVQRQWDFDKAAYTEVEKGKMINSPRWNGLTPSEAIKKAIEWLESEGIGKAANSYHLRDWIFSRQHYWGEPIPMIFCQRCAENQKSQITKNSFQTSSNNQFPNSKQKIERENYGWYPVPEDQLPVVLPEVEHYEPTDTGESPLAKIEEFVRCKCPVCGGEARRETDTMPNWAGSDWYYLAYCFANKLASTKFQIPNSKQITNSKSQIQNRNIFEENKEELKKWMPVDIYIGGDEHNTLHLLYSRFIYKFLYDLGVVPTSEPYFKRMSHGVILGPDGQRMSKSRGNVIVPDEMVAKYGADVVRMYLMFMGPFEGTMAWNEKTLIGVKRFLERFEKYINNQITNHKSQITNNDQASKFKTQTKVVINKAIEGVTKDIEGFSFNTAIAKMMEMVNQLSIINYQLSSEDLETIIKLIAPFAPFTAEKWWKKTGVRDAGWPEADTKCLIEETVTIPVAVNGKVRGQLKVNNGGAAYMQPVQGVLEEAKKLEAIQKWLEGKQIVKEFYIEGKMVNFVV